MLQFLRWPLCLVCLRLLLATTVGILILIALRRHHHRHHHRSRPRRRQQKLFAADKREVTLKELMKDLERNPDKYLSNTNVVKKSKRTRKKVANPQQEYVYAAQKTSCWRNHTNQTNHVIVSRIQG